MGRRVQVVDVGGEGRSSVRCDVDLRGQPLVARRRVLARASPPRRQARVEGVGEEVDVGVLAGARADVHGAQGSAILGPRGRAITRKDARRTPYVAVERRVDMVDDGAAASRVDVLRAVRRRGLERPDAREERRRERRVDGRVGLERTGDGRGARERVRGRVPREPARLAERPVELELRVLWHGPACHILAPAHDDRGVRDLLPPPVFTEHLAAQLAEPHLERAERGRAVAIVRIQERRRVRAPSGASHHLLSRCVFIFKFFGKFYFVFIKCL